MERIGKIGAPRPVRAGNLVMRFDLRPYIMGVVNITPDSFSDGGRYFDRQQAIDHALALAEEGADVLDLGGESSRPGSDPVTVEEELSRVVPVVEGIRKWCTQAISVDTTKADVAEAALEAGADMINDISALRFDERLADVVAERRVPVVLMHMRGTPKTMQEGTIAYKDLMGEIVAFLRDAIARARDAGIDEERVIVDPGIGFGKTLEHNLTIMKRLHRLSVLGRPVLVGPSRKRFIGDLTAQPPDKREFGTAAAVVAAILAGANIVRVHSVEQMRQAATVAHAIAQEKDVTSVWAGGGVC